jgi:hypothetical protein
MRTQDIVIGETYRHRINANVGYAKAIKIIKPMAKFKQKYSDYTEDEKSIKNVVVKCECSMLKNDVIGFIKYFRPCDLVKCKD